MKVYRLFIAGALLLVGSRGEAQSLTEMLPSWTKNISAAVSNTLATGLNGQHPKSYNDFGLNPSYLIQEDVTAGLSIGVVKEFTQEKKWLMKDSLITIQHKNVYEFLPFDFKMAAYGNLFLPLSKASQDESRILTLKPGLRLSKEIEALKFNVDLSSSYFIHKYTTTVGGGSNKHYGFTNTLTAGYQLTEQLFLNSIWSFLYFSTYNATPKPTYSFIQEMNYALSPTLSATLGHSVGGRQYKNNGEELNLSLFDVDGSEVFMEASILF